MDTKHIVTAYDEDLSELERIVAEMGGLAEVQLADAITALTRRDPELAARVIKRDEQLDEMELEIHERTIRLLALRQPMAADLRITLAALKISSSLERIGDYSKNIAKRAVLLSRSPNLPDASQAVARMAQLVQTMIKNVLDAYFERDTAKADDVRARDQDVDRLYNSLFREILTYMMEDPRTITTATHLLFVAKNIERSGDHATGIAEQIHFAMAGSLPKDVRPKEEDTALPEITTVAMLKETTE